MSRDQLLQEIENLRTRMNNMSSTGADYAAVLEVSQQLDVLIVMFHKIAA